jgi:hypothetical protein
MADERDSRGEMAKVSAQWNRACNQILLGHRSVTVSLRSLAGRARYFGCLAHGLVRSLGSLGDLLFHAEDKKLSAPLDREVISLVTCASVVA